MLKSGWKKILEIQKEPISESGKQYPKLTLRILDGVKSCVLFVLKRKSVKTASTMS